MSNSFSHFCMHRLCQHSMLLSIKLVSSLARPKARQLCTTSSCVVRDRARFTPASARRSGTPSMPRRHKQKASRQEPRSDRTHTKPQLASRRSRSSRQWRSWDSNGGFIFLSSFSLFSFCSFSSFLLPLSFLLSLFYSCLKNVRRALGAPWVLWE